MAVAHEIRPLGTTKAALLLERAVLSPGPIAVLDASLGLAYALVEGGYLIEGPPGYFRPSDAYLTELRIISLP